MEHITLYQNAKKKGHLATMKELQQVVPFHVEKFNDILSRCKQSPKHVSLIFATRFICLEVTAKQGILRTQYMRFSYSVIKA